MVYYFTVRVPLEEVTRESLDFSSRVNLPTEVELVDNLTLSKGDGEYYLVTCTDIMASRESEAKNIGVKKTENLVRLFAAHNDAFQIILSSVNVEINGPLEPQTATVVETDTGIVITLPPAEVFASGSLNLVKGKSNLDFEASALAVQDKWSEQVRTAIDFNYLAVIANNPKTSFFLLASALQALAYGALGSQKNLLSTKMDKRRRQEFKLSLDRFLKQWIPEESERTRIKGQVIGTHKEPIANHLFAYLTSIGVEDYDLDEVKDWWKLRGKIAHPIKKIDDKVLRQPLSSILNATQRAIRKEIEVLTEDKY